MEDTSYLVTMENTEIRKALSYLTYKMMKRTFTEKDRETQKTLRKELEERRSVYDERNDSINSPGRTYRPGGEDE